MKKLLVRILWVVLVLLPITWLLLKRAPEERKKDRSKGSRPVEGQVLKPSTLLDDIVVSGSLLSGDEVELKNEAGGRIVFLYLPEGQAVKKGRLLVKIFDDDLQAGLRKLQAQLALQEQMLARQAELIRINGISRNEYDQSRLQVSNLQAEIDVQKAQIRKTEVLAPFDGVVGLRNVSIGAVVSTSVTLATFRSNDLKLDFHVPEQYGDRIRPGMEVDFTLFDDEAIHRARVSATERSIEDASRQLTVRALVSDRSAKLLPGAFANVRLRLGERQDAVLIPTEAILPMERDKQVVVSRGGKAHFVTVKTGLRKAAMVEITEGLQPGDTLVTSGLLFLKEGSDLTFSHLNGQP